MIGVFQIRDCDFLSHVKKSLTILDEEFLKKP